MNTQANKIDLTTAAEGTMILTPWGRDSDRQPVKFTGICKDWNEDNEEVYAINYIDANGDQFCVFADTQFAIPA